MRLRVVALTILAACAGGTGPALDVLRTNDVHSPDLGRELDVDTDFGVDAQDVSLVPDASEVPVVVDADETLDVPDTADADEACPPGTFKDLPDTPAGIALAWYLCHVVNRTPISDAEFKERFSRHAQDTTSLDSLNVEIAARGAPGPLEYKGRQDPGEPNSNPEVEVGNLADSAELLIYAWVSVQRAPPALLTGVDLRQNFFLDPTLDQSTAHLNLQVSEEGTTNDFVPGATVDVFAWDTGLPLDPPVSTVVSPYGTAQLPLHPATSPFGFRIVHPDGTVNLIYDSDPTIQHATAWPSIRHMISIWSKATIAAQTAEAAVVQDPARAIVVCLTDATDTGKWDPIGCATGSFDPPASAVFYRWPGGINLMNDATDPVFGEFVAFNVAPGPETCIATASGSPSVQSKVSAAAGAVTQANIIHSFATIGCGEPVPPELDCAQETTLKATLSPRTAHLKVTQPYPATSSVDIYRLTTTGSRDFVDRCTGGSNYFVTQEGQPWVVTDTAGNCLHLVVPGPGSSQLNLP